MTVVCLVWYSCLWRLWWPNPAYCWWRIYWGKWWGRSGPAPRSMSSFLYLSCPGSSFHPHLKSKGFIAPLHKYWLWQWVNWWFSLNTAGFQALFLKFKSNQLTLDSFSSLLLSRYNQWFPNLLSKTRYPSSQATSSQWLGLRRRPKRVQQ